MDNLPSETHFEPAFQLNALVESIPDTTRGIDPEHSVALYGNIAAMKDEDGWWYRIKCMHTGRNGSWIPECRIKAKSKALYENAMLETRAFNGKERYEVMRNKSIATFYNWFYFIYSNN